MEEIETLISYVCYPSYPHQPSCPMRNDRLQFGIFGHFQAPARPYLPDITLSAILVDSVIMDDTPEALLADYDLIFTTETHYSQDEQ